MHSQNILSSLLVLSKCSERKFCNHHAQFAAAWITYNIMLLLITLHVLFSVIMQAMMHMQYSATSIIRTPLSTG